MRTAIILLSFLLFLWIAGSSYVYVCKVRNDCCTEKVAKLSASVSDSPGKTVVEKPAVPVPSLYSLYFDFNKSQCEISDEITKHFQLFKQYLSVTPGKKILVTGYSDNSGTIWSKEYIGAQRAEFVKQKLSDAGIVSVVITATSMGDRAPVGDNNTSIGRAKNRRVDIVIQ